ncbi:VIR protein [Plasmodium vivax]|uniref:VIR protein n=1 Tax=Plasmodium vivax TaxID=5855 RepID=A0A1G4E8M4_PLAVI|nr:VIR protein [Plasmodium vivax]
MTSNKEDMLYIQHHNYNYVIRQHNRAIDYKHYGEEPLDEIMPHMRTLNNKLEKNDYIVKTFFKLLSNSVPYIDGQVPNYCKYVNLWLNKEYLKENNQTKIPNFGVFKAFVKKLNEVKAGYGNKSCEEYINPLDSKTITKIDFLYLLYDLYNKINNSKTTETDLNNACSKLAVLTKDYRDSIYNYYDKDKDLYNKLENIIKLIHDKTGNNSPCKESISFIKPINLVNRQNEEEALKQAAEQEKLNREKAATRQVREEEDPNHPDLLQSKDLSSKSLDNGLQVLRQENGDVHSTSYRAGLPELVTSGLPRHTQRFESAERQESPTGSFWLKGHTPQRRNTYTIEGMVEPSEVVHEQEDKGITRPGTLGGSTGIPGYITEVFGSVDPVPVVGVSGGMGALFLLFRYTPLGTFFRGGRGRAHRIPRSFNGQFLGAFPDVNEYNGGYIGYGPMDIPYGAE